MTDSEHGLTYDPETRPGLGNLLLIWSALDSEGRSPQQLATMAQNQGWGMGRLKEEVAGVVQERIEPVRKEYQRIQADLGYLQQVAKSGRDRAREVAAKTMDEVRSVVGLSEI